MNALDGKIKCSPAPSSLLSPSLASAPRAELRFSDALLKDRRGIWVPRREVHPSRLITNRGLSLNILFFRLQKKKRGMCVARNEENLTCLQSVRTCFKKCCCLTMSGGTLTSTSQYASTTLICTVKQANCSQPR